MFVDQIFQRAHAFLFGRRTYEHFAATWGTWPNPGDSPSREALHTQPKYVASTTLTDPQWTNMIVLSGDPGDLVASRAFPNGSTLQVYRPAGRPRYASD